MIRGISFGSQTVDFDCSNNVKSSFLEAECEASATRKKVNSKEFWL